MTASDDERPAGTVSLEAPWRGEETEESPAHAAAEEDSESAAPPAQAPSPLAPEAPRTTMAPLVPAASAPLRHGERIGRYVLLKVLGQGGMGAVYAAFDPELERNVALKLLRPDSASADAEHGRARLLREAQAMARISHPNVLPVFDVGTWEDQVFIALEFVDGGTLSEWLRAERPWREVLGLFLAAGRGLAAAHAAGLVHRDFKPANVLLGSNGRVYVTDFGLARLSALGEDEEQSPSGPSTVPSRLQESITQAGTVLGTPAYMPPEQYRGNVPDARSDQFSFCAALYRALYRQRPFEPQRMAELATTSHSAPRQQATHTLSAGSAEAGSALAEPLIHEPPRHVRVPPWLRRAVLRGLALKPEERFPSMEALLEALSQGQRRVRRWRLAGAAALLGAALASGGAVAYQRSQVCTSAPSLMAEVWSPAVRQRLETAFLATGKPYAPHAVRQTSQLLEDYAQGWMRQHTESCRATRIHGAQTEELLGLRAVCLERRRRDMRALVELLTQADAVVVTKAVDMAWRLPTLAECEDVEDLAQQQALPSNPTQRAEIERLGSRLSALKALLDAGRYQDALEQVRLLEPQVQATGWLPLQAELRMYQGWLQIQSYELEAAVHSLQLAVADAEAGRADRLKMRILNLLPYLHGLLEHEELASTWELLARSTLQRIGREPQLASDLLLNLAYMAFAQRRYPQARELLEQAREAQDKALPSGHPKRIALTHLAGQVAERLGDSERAFELLSQALRQTEATLGRQHPELSRSHRAISQLLRDRGDLAAALPHAQAHLSLSQATFGLEHLEVASALDELGMCLLGLGRHAEALPLFEQSLAMKQRLLGPEHAELQFSYDGLGQALLGLGRTADSLSALQKALSFSAAPPEALAESNFALARALSQTGSQRPRARQEAARARERFLQAGLQQRARQVEEWLSALEP
jgi:eukaryotic-like serine/threonine-protein kinase